MPNTELAKIKAVFDCMVAVYCVIGNKKRNVAEKEAYKHVINIYGEDYIENLINKESD